MIKLFEFLKKKNNILETVQGDASVNNLAIDLASLVEAYSREYESIRREIDLRIELEERTIGNLLLLIAALFSASQLFYTQANQIIVVLNRNTFLYLTMAWISLVFPITILQHDLYIAALGRYIRYVLSPKIRTLAVDVYPGPIKNFSQWEVKQFPVWLRGPIRWEDYRLQTQYRSTVPLFGLIAIFRYAFASSPSLLFITAFFWAKSKVVFWVDWSPLDRISLVVLVIFVLAIIAGILMGIRAFTWNEFPKDTA